MMHVENSEQKHESAGMQFVRNKRTTGHAQLLCPSLAHPSVHALLPAPCSPPGTPDTASPLEQRPSNLTPPTFLYPASVTLCLFTYHTGPSKTFLDRKREMVRSANARCGNCRWFTINSGSKHQLLSVDCIFA